ncbi:hypothetical protein JB92DRAFT_2880450 [Gautieria morchelliformis]|nr:hypothetical protein JB92DRAFT_2880450 [Gautieria morchelliformis]
MMWFATACRARLHAPPWSGVDIAFSTPCLPDLRREITPSYSMSLAGGTHLSAEQANPGYLAHPHHPGQYVPPPLFSDTAPAHQRRETEPGAATLAVSSMVEDHDYNTYYQPYYSSSDPPRIVTSKPPIGNYELHQPGSPTFSPQQNFGSWTSGNDYSPHGSAQPYQYYSSRRGTSASSFPHDPHRENLHSQVFDSQQQHTQHQNMHLGYGISDSTHPTPQISSSSRLTVPLVPYRHGTSCASSTPTLSVTASRSIERRASPPPSTPTSVLNANAPAEHLIQGIPVSQRDVARYIDQPSRKDARWRLGSLMCIYPGCQSPVVESNRMVSHVARHLNDKKAYECLCGTRFGRLSEANRHIDDQRPCELCNESRRKRKGTRICSRCFGRASSSSRRR